MCGILCVLGKRAQLITGTLTHRGPDASRVVTIGNCTMEFSRLAINDLSEDGMQPFIGKANKSMLVCNGEIYNHKSLSDVTGSDCACLLPMVESYGIMTLSQAIRGVFAICYTDGEKVLVSRDHLGIRPLFFTRFTDDDGKPGIAFASEVKGLLQFESQVHVFPPGHIFDSSVDFGAIGSLSPAFVSWYPCYWDDPSTTKTEDIRIVFEQAVKIRLENTERSVGFLLSGGLDSSLVVATAKKFLPNLKTFSIATSPDSPDAKAARVVADYLGTDHTEIIFTVDEGLAALEEVIKTLESYDTTTVRASVPMWCDVRF
jgi:asparagine synthase (glutamine-hydrolysing)